MEGLNKILCVSSAPSVVDSKPNLYPKALRSRSGAVYARILSA